MIVIGHIDLPFPQFKNIEKIKDIEQTSANDIVYFTPNATLAKHCKDNNIAYGIIIKNVLELVIYANLNATYLLIKDRKLVETAQKIANEYFFDSKILYVINDERDIENMALLGIDGVIFESILL